MRSWVAASASGGLAVLGFLVGCSRGPVPDGVSAREPLEVVVQVDNHYAGMVTVYLHSGGTALRLGQLSFQEVKSFVLPWRRLSADGVFVLRAEVIGSSARALTDDLRVQPGQVVRWTLTPSLEMSSVSIY